MSEFKIRLGGTEIDLLKFAEQKPILPYNGTSGWSGSDTSLERAVRNDTDGTTGKRQKATLELLDGSGAQGMTWKELSDETGWHHGSASGVLSVLHKAGQINRLKTTRRNRCAVYVSAHHTYGRETVQPKIKRCRHCGGVQ